MPLDFRNDSDNATEELEPVMEQDKELYDNEEGEEFDLEEERYFEWGVGGKKMMISYKNGWFTGSIDYYNIDLGKNHISFDDGSEDYSSERN